jgi:hypothetical protein
LTCITLNDNEIYDEGSSAIGKALRQSNVLKELFLNGNNIGLTGAVTLAETLLAWTNLNLGRLKLAMTAAWQSPMPFEAVQHCYGLRLNLDDNSVRDTGAMLLLKAVKEYSLGLTSLNLEGNPDVSSYLQNDIDFVLASRLALHSLLKHVHKPLEKRLIPCVAHAVKRRCLPQEARSVSLPVHCS